MKISELMKDLYDSTDTTGDYSKTCDTIKAGDPEREVRKVATAMFATPELIRQAAAWGAELIIVHEPTFYSHYDNPMSSDPVYEAKLKLIRDSGVTIYRFHDHPHANYEDMICQGELKYSGLKGTWRKGPRYAVNSLVLDTEMTAREIAKVLEEKLNIAHVRICGATDLPCRNVSLCFGTPGGVFEELQKKDIDVLLVGEACEWALGEYVRDASQLGMKKAMLILGHIGSERDGMRLLADIMQEKYPQLETKYFECGEVYTYTNKK